ncbi:HD domain-containing protein [Mongoliitalea daihaiensis]|uniref:HD domain-containing protein n=1 Tax=Mongoliitalea daihaiensis TaxID=2782006 RepID=UPI001F3FDE4F|nr:phosphohydrolase [Mongoliitalea daihaiensis]UJP64336.1 HD family phosphohydrolase [Mongoliitalea daihaiensis]
MEKKQQLFERMFKRLKDDLPSFMVYHDLKHTKQVIDNSIFLGKMEGCTDYELDVLSIAALYHDSGFLLGSESHEMKGCFLIKADLPSYGFSSHEIEQICGMIMATKTPQSPHNKLEQILADADLFYLGTDQYVNQSMLLKNELIHFNPSLKDEEWKEIQVDFLETHVYHTDYGKTVLSPIKQKNLDKILRS